MNHPIRNRVKVVKLDLSTLKRSLFRKVSIDNTYIMARKIDDMIEALRFAKNFQIEIVDDQLPEPLIEAIKWFSFYDFKPKLVLANQSLVGKYIVLNENYTIDSTISKNLITINDDYPISYIIDKTIVRILRVNDVVQTKSPEDIILLFKGESPNEEIRTLFNRSHQYPIFNVKDYESNQEAVVYDEGMINQGVYCFINHVFFKLVANDNQYFLEELFDDFLPSNVFLPTPLTSHKTYSIVNRTLVENHSEMKKIDIYESTKEFSDFYDLISRFETTSIAETYRNYSGVEITINLKPPYINHQSDNRISPIYSEIHRLVELMRNQMTDTHSGFNGKIQQIYNEINQIVGDDSMNYDQIVMKLSNYLGNRDNLYNNLKSKFVSDFSMFYMKEQSERSHPISYDESTHNDDEKNTKTDFGRIFDEYMTSKAENIPFYPSTLARIYHIDAKPETDLSILKMARRILDMSDEYVKHQNLIHLLPSVGTIHVDGSNNQFIVIKYEEEIIQALNESKRLNMKILVKEESHEHVS